MNCVGYGVSYLPTVSNVVVCHNHLVHLTIDKHQCDCCFAEYSNAVETQIINIERDGGVLYSWKVSGVPSFFCHYTLN